MSADELSARAEIERRLLEGIRQKLGPLVCQKLDDPEVIEIMLNADGSLWEDRLGTGMSKIGTLSPVAAESFISMIATKLHTTVTRQSPVLEAELPIRGARFEALVPPLVAQPVFAIRLKATKVFTLDDYVSDGIMTGRQREIIEDAAHRRVNILISGGTSSGKTTLANAVLKAQTDRKPEARVLILEDTIELQCEAENSVALRTSKNVDMQDLLKVCMRMRPDSIIVGEVRDGAALQMVKAWNTGHDAGLCTVHSNSAKSALVRLQRLIAEATQADMRQDIAEAVNLVIPIAKTGATRVVEQIIRVEGFHAGEFVLTPEN